MGKGSRVGGSGWAGVHGSLVGMGRGFPGPKPSFAKKPKAKNGKKKEVKQPIPKFKGRGLTIPEQIKAGEKKVGRIWSEIKQTERKLLELNCQLESANSDLEKARNQPRKTALGQALHQASKAATKATGSQEPSRASINGRSTA